MRHSRLTCALVIASTVLAGAAPNAAYAQETSPAAQPGGASSPLNLERDAPSSALIDAPVAPAEAPPPPPYKKSVVLESSVGALVFLGKFGQTAPPAPWLRAQLGYELFKWLMVFGEGEIGFTDTSRSQEPPKTRAFPIFALGAGARLTVRFAHRFGLYAQGSLGAMKADIRRRALEIIGFRDAEDLGLYVGGRVGLEWYQVDRHFALGITAGLRDASGFEKVASGGDSALAFDAGASIRYAF